MPKAGRLSGIRDVVRESIRPGAVIERLPVLYHDNVPAAYRAILAWLHAFPQLY